MKHKVIKRSLTLIELMVVIFIIGIIGAVIGINMRGSLDEGKAFKSSKGSKQVYEILNLEYAKNAANISEIINNPVKVIKNSKLARDPEKLIQDGWGENYQITYDETHDDFYVTSRKYFDYLKNKKGMSEAAIEKEMPWMDRNALKVESKSA